MLPPFLAALPAEVDVLATATPTTTAMVGTIGDSRYAMVLASANVSLWARILRPRNAFIFDVSGRYGRALAATDTIPAQQDIAARARARLDVTTSSRTRFTFMSNGFVSSRIGLRADDDLVVRDPFMTNRVLYGFGAQPSFQAITSPRTSFRFDVQYAQAGAVSADSPEAVGIDTHALTANATATMQLAPRIAIGPIARIAMTHFEHALLDVNLTRGHADVMSASVLGLARYDITARTQATAVVGLTAATAPPQTKDTSTLISPDARFELRSFGPRVGGSAGVALGYRSLGPRIGFGMDYSGFLDGWVRPFSGGNYRDVLAHVVARARRANSILAIAPQSDGAVIGNSQTGKLATTAFALGAAVTSPIRVGWNFSAGIDLELVSTRVDPEPRGGQPREIFRALFTVGLTAITSTDPLRRLPRDPFQLPGDPRGAAARRAAARTGSQPQPNDVGDFWDEESE
ncbi:MAG: hypothetical protein IPM54_28505 [Polyangiaceae bacterium]|nr:hypothetical protein [Polyangiaceae bacterium]